ncbi:MAG TPA: prepilin-type N-terminal cleavage/methylation domain-containing protein [Planctomycetota bacterium]|nr:prepilin-type N-terminal cleavage/methylation domain-containing protein [Planctomycetota bacterium]
MANPRSAIRNPKSAVTLIELLVTMSVVAILMLGGVAVYWRMNRGFALQAATSGIESALRSARAFAVHERSPAVVVAEPQADNPALVALVYALGRQTVSGWHFESPAQFAGGKVLGALGQEATATGATPAPGRIGTALLLDGGSTSLQVTSPYLDGVREGLFIEADVYPEASATDTLLPIVCKKDAASDSYGLALRYDAATGLLSLEGGVLMDNSAPSGLHAPDPSAPANALIRNGEWTRVALAYTRDAVKDGGGTPVPTGILELRVNGMEVARAETPLSFPEDGRLSQVAGSLWIGTNGASYFRGRIDELKIAGLVAGETHVLPKNTEVTFDAGGSADGRVHFDREGKLDSVHHARPVFFRVISAEDRLLRVVRVNWLGCVEVFNGEPPPDQ